MNRLLICAVLALGLAACGHGAQESARTAQTPPASQPATPAQEPAASTAEAPPAAQAAQAAATDDGESVDNVTAAVSPIEAAVADNAPAVGGTLPAKWQEGTNVPALPAAQPVSVPPGDVEVTEIFWYGCGHCFALEPYLESWEKKTKPAWVKLVRMPVVWNEVTREDARTFYTLKALGKLDQLHLAVFRELHVNHKPLTIVAGNAVDQGATQRRVREFLVANGVSAEEFDRTYRSFAVETELRQAENLSRRYVADHTPMVVVQGKYTTDVGMAGGVNQLFELVDDLAAREHAGR